MSDPAAALPRELAQLLGTVIAGAYRIDDVLGSGNMGVVFRGEQLKLKRAIAVKVLDPEIAGSGSARQRFAREAESVARLDHRNCLTVYDYGTTSEGLHYMVMPLLRGQALSETLEGGPLAPRRALGVLEQVLGGLSHAHSQGLVHRDLKPSNILLTRGDERDEVVKIVDFGIAKIIDDDGTFQTRTGMLFGTPAYMSPEQAVGETIDARSDLYSAGLVLYRMITGRLPHRARSVVDQLRKRATLEVPPIGDPCPEEISWLITQLCARRPKDRVQDAASARDVVTGLMDSVAEGTAGWDLPLNGLSLDDPEGETWIEGDGRNPTFDPGELSAALVSSELSGTKPLVERGDAAQAEDPSGPTAPLQDPGHTSPDTLTERTDERPGASWEPAPIETMEFDGPLHSPRVGPATGMQGVGEETTFVEGGGEPDPAVKEANRRSAGFWFALALLGGVGLGIASFLGTSSGQPSSQKAVIQAPQGQAEDRPLAAEPTELKPLAEPETGLADAQALPVEGALLSQLAEVNRRDPGSWLPFVERHQKLEELRADERAAVLVDETANALADLAQAEAALSDPAARCEVWSQALDTLQAGNATEFRRALRTLEAPSSPESCQKLRRRVKSLRASSKRSNIPTSKAGVESPELGEDKPPQAGEITPKLGGLKP